MLRLSRFAAPFAASFSVIAASLPACAQNPPPPPAAPAPPPAPAKAPPAAPATTPAPPPATTPTPPANAAPAAPAAALLNIPEGTEIKVTLQKELKSGTAKEGESVPFLVEKDVTGPNGVIYVKAGTPAVGKVLQSKPHGFIGKPGKLEFTCDYVQLPGGGHLPLRSTAKTKYGQNNTSASVAAAVVLTPVALLLPGKDTTARQGQEFTLYTNSAATIAADGTLTVTGTASSASQPAPGTPPAPAAPGKSAFLMNDGTTTVGTITAFDGKTYNIAVDGGTKQIKAADVKNISPVK